MLYALLADLSTINKIALAQAGATRRFNNPYINSVLVSYIIVLLLLDVVPYFLPKHVFAHTVTYTLVRSTFPSNTQLAGRVSLRKI